jgi:hypothetical protein
VQRHGASKTRVNALMVLHRAPDKVGHAILPHRAEYSPLAKAAPAGQEIRRIRNASGD